MNDYDFLMTTFVREDCFYPVQMLPPLACGKSVAEQASEHAELNPGTIRVEDLEGRVL